MGYRGDSRNPYNKMRKEDPAPKGTQMGNAQLKGAILKYEMGEPLTETQKKALIAAGHVPKNAFNK